MTRPPNRVAANVELRFVKAFRALTRVRVRVAFCSLNAEGNIWGILGDARLPRNDDALGFDSVVNLVFGIFTVARVVEAGEEFSRSAGLVEGGVARGVEFLGEDEIWQEEENETEMEVRSHHDSSDSLEFQMKLYYTCNFEICKKKWKSCYQIFMRNTQLHCPKPSLRL